MTSRKKLQTYNTAAVTDGFTNKCGSFFRQKRLMAGLSEEYVSSYMEFSLKTLRSYESGEKAIPLDRAYALSNCLNIPPSEVMNLFNEHA